MSKEKQVSKVSQSLKNKISKKVDDNLLKIAVMPMADDGCSHYRINKPYRMLEEMGLAYVKFFKPAEIEQQDFADHLHLVDLVVCRQYHNRAILKTIDKYFKGVRVLLDLDDDLFNIDPYNEAYGAYGTKEVKHNNKWLWKDGLNMDISTNKKEVNLLKKFLKRADIVSVSTPRLKEALSKYNDNIIVNYNSIDKRDWLVREFVKKEDEIRIGWTGGASHYKDWLTIQEDLLRVMKDFPQVKLVIGGTMFEGVFKDIDPSRIEHYDWVSPSAHGFRTALMNLDIAIVPLEESTFNSNKSCIKFYEFGSLKVPTICSAVPPYSDEVPVELLFDKLYDKIVPLIKSKELRDKVGNIIYSWIMKHRNLKNVTEDLYNNICDKLTDLNTKANL